MGRRKAREELFKLVFEADMKDELPVNIAPYFVKNNIEADAEEAAFILKYSKSISESFDKINSMIEENMTGWTLDRLGTVERVLLRIAVYELINEQNTDFRIAVNEAVELAKIYGEEKSYEFINGVLAKVIGKLGISAIKQN